MIISMGYKNILSFEIISGKKAIAPAGGNVLPVTAKIINSAIIARQAQAHSGNEQNSKRHRAPKPAIAETPTQTSVAKGFLELM